MELNKDKLNEYQEKVIESDFPILVIAGPGSGKTKTVVEKTLKINENFENLKENLILTFTNKAANNIFIKLEEKFKKEIDRKEYFIGTFHSIFFKLLKINNEYFKLGFKGKLKIIEPEDNKKLFLTFLFDKYRDPKIKETKKDLTEKFFLIHKLYPLDFFYNYNSLINNIQNSYEELIQNCIKKSSADNDNKEILKEIFTKFIEYKKERNFISFEDILLEFYFLLKNFTDIREFYKNKFKYIIVDEYQDTNPIQDKIIEFLSNNNYCFVGDPSQGIYGFLGSNYKNIMNIRNRKNINYHQLIYNYRSTENIVNFSNDLITLFEDKIQDIKPCVSKNLLSDNRKIRLYQNQNYPELIIINDILNEIKSGSKYSDIAVISRTNFETNKLEFYLKDRKIPYKKNGGKSIYNLKYIMIILSIVNIKVKNFTLNDIENVFLTFDKVGKSSIEKLINTHLINRKELFTIIEEDFPKNKHLNYIKKIFDNLKLEKDDIFNLLFKDDKFKFIEKNVSNLTVQKLEEIKKNVSFILEELNTFFINKDMEGLNEYINTILLNPDNKEEEEDKIILTTAHSAKGLEWNSCYILNTDNKSFPMDRSFSYKDLYEEEKRVFFVACSRAKENLVLLSSVEMNDFVKPFINKKYFHIIDGNNH